MDEQTAQEETEDKLKQCIDNLTDKRYTFCHPVTINNKNVKCGGITRKTNAPATVVDIVLIDIMSLKNLNFLSLFVFLSLFQC